MKDFLKQILREEQNKTRGRSKIREYLQARILEVLQNNNYFNNWVFVGGTALRFLFSIPRFSEDLDFSLLKPGMDADFSKALKKIEKCFEHEGYEIRLKAKETKIVQSAFIQFRGLLYELDYSPHHDEAVSIKIEIDTNPPLGATSTFSIVRKYVTLNLHHHDKASLFAGKLHALLTRKYTKGRDVYDLFWYLTDRHWPAPNCEFLQNALKQTGWNRDPVTDQNWKTIISHKLKQLNWNTVINDVKPFLEKSEELNFLTPENFEKMITL